MTSSIVVVALTTSNGVSTTSPSSLLFSLSISSTNSHSPLSLRLDFSLFLSQLFVHRLETLHQRKRDDGTGHCHQRFRNRGRNRRRDCRHRRRGGYDLLLIRHASIVVSQTPPVPPPVRYLHRSFARSQNNVSRRIASLDTLSPVSHLSIPSSCICLFRSSHDHHRPSPNDRFRRRRPSRRTTLPQSVHRFFPKLILGFFQHVQGNRRRSRLHLVFVFDAFRDDSAHVWRISPPPPPPPVFSFGTEHDTSSSFVGVLPSPHRRRRRPSHTRVGRRRAEMCFFPRRHKRRKRRERLYHRQSAFVFDFCGALLRRTKLSSSCAEEVVAL